MWCLFTGMTTSNWILIHCTINGPLLEKGFCSVHDRKGINLNVGIFFVLKGVSRFQRGLGIMRFQQMQYLFKELFRVVCDSVQSNLIVQLSLLSISHFVLPFMRHLYVQRILLCHAIDVATQHTAAVRWISLNTPLLATTGESEQHPWKTTQRATLCYVNAIIFSSSFSHKRNCI